MNRSLKFLFFVQGEGRGHLTQALSLHHILTEAGHQVSQVLVGKSARRQLPAFFTEKMGSPISTFESPNFVTDGREKAIHLGKTIIHNGRRAGTFHRSLRQIHQLVQQTQPDVIINFYDLLGGLYNLIYRPNVPFVGIGHQYFLQHSDFQFPEKERINELLLRFNTWVTAFGADRKLGLSFRALPDERGSKLAVVPPLLRKEVRQLTPATGNYFLLYMTNSGYGEEVIAWHQQHPEVELHCFWDKKDAPEVWHYSPNLTFHQLNDVKFLEYMRGCRGYVSTAGFESVCEAMYLGKPVLMVPIEGQFEQTCNALDGLKSGAGVSAHSFDLDRLLAFLPQYQGVGERFQQWEAQADQRFVQELEKAYVLYHRKRSLARRLPLLRTVMNYLKPLPEPAL